MPKLDKKGVIDRFVGKFPHNENENPESTVPKMHLNITELKNTELGNFMSRYSAWREYTESLLTVAMAEFTLAEEKYRKEFTLKKFSGEYDSYKGKKLSLKDKDAFIDTDEEIIRFREKMIECEVYKDMLSSKLESFSNAIATISREITRRQNSFSPRD